MESVLYLCYIKTNTMDTDKTIILKITKELKEEFFAYCTSIGYSPSKRLRVMIENEIKSKTV